MSLLDEDSGVVDGPGETLLEQHRLQSSVHEFVQGQTQHIIELVLVFAQQTVAHHPSHKGRTLEETPWVMLVQGQKLSRSLSDTGKGQLDSPDLPLVLEPVFTDYLHLVVQTLLLEGPPRGLEGSRGWKKGEGWEKRRKYCFGRFYPFGNIA